MAPLLALEASSKRFGGLLANREVSLAIEAGEIVGLIGPNGAGKTTLFNCITGYMHPDEPGASSSTAPTSRHARPERICRLGVARTWQVVRAFGRMTALDNVVCGALQRTSRVAEARARATELLEFTELHGRGDMPAATLTLADKKRWRSPARWRRGRKLLLLDEAMSGLTPIETPRRCSWCAGSTRELKVTICVVEHVMEVVMPLSHRVVVLDYGVKIADGAPEAVVRDEEVIRAYLGERRAAR